MDELLEKEKYWNTGDSQIKKFEIISETTSEVRNYNQLRNFVNNIDFKKTLNEKNRNISISLTHHNAHYEIARKSH